MSGVAGPCPQLSTGSSAGFLTIKCGEFNILLSFCPLSVRAGRVSARGTLSRPSWGSCVCHEESVGYTSIGRGSSSVLKTPGSQTALFPERLELVSPRYTSWKVA